MASTNEDIVTTKKFRGADAVFDIGYHGEGNFDNLSGRRKAASLIVPRFVEYRLPDGADVTAFDIVLAGLIQKAELIAVQVIPEVIPAGGTKAFHVDVQKGNGSDAYATVLTAVVDVTTASANRTAQLGSIDSTKKDFAAGDSAKLVVTVDGAGGTNGQGGVITLLFYEHGAA